MVCLENALARISRIVLAGGRNHGSEGEMI